MKKLCPYSSIFIAWPEEAEAVDIWFVQVCHCTAVMQQVRFINVHLWGIALFLLSRCWPLLGVKPSIFDVFLASTYTDKYFSIGSMHVGTSQDRFYASNDKFAGSHNNNSDITAEIYQCRSWLIQHSSIYACIHVYTVVARFTLCEDEYTTLIKLSTFTA